MTREEARQFGISLLEGIAERNTGKYAENVRLAIASLTEPLLSSNIDEVAKEYGRKEYDCINCPRMTVMEMYNTSSGTSTATLHGNTSATDGKEHNPSFTD